MRTLKKRAAFVKATASLHRWHIPSCVIQALSAAEALAIEKASPDAPQLIGFTASKRIGNAVKRNRAKRRLRAAAADVLPQASADGLALVFVAKHAALTQPFADLSADMAKAVRILVKKHV